MKLTLRIWRQTNADHQGHYESHQLKNVSPDLSLLEALDQLNEQLISSGERPVSFEHDCREGICGSCRRRTRAASSLPNRPAACTCATESSSGSPYSRSSAPPPSGSNAPAAGTSAGAPN